MKSGWLKHLDFYFVDIVSLELSWAATCLCAAGFWSMKFQEPWRMGSLLLFIHLLCSMVMDAYNSVLQRGYLKEFLAVLRLELMVFVMLLFFLYFLKLSLYTPRRILVLYFALALPLTYVLRFVHKFHLRRWYRKVKHSRQIVVVATKDAAGSLIRAIDSSAIRNYQFFGLAVVDEPMCGQKIGSMEVTADRDHLIEYVQKQVVDEIFIRIPGDPSYSLTLAQKLLDMGVTVHICMDEAYQALPNSSISNIFGYHVLTTRISSISFNQALLKRLMDICGGFVGCVLALLIGIVIAPLIYLRSPGPILFSQTRVGKRGRKFKLYKFRSMYPDAERRKKELLEKNKISGGLMFKLENDPRIIPGIGRFIRKSSLDEFPQFFNVLKGDMSLVGTRPPTVDEYERYSPHHKKRLCMLPGITGLWQVSGRSKITDFEEVVRLDTEYIENWSIELDIKIILKTILRIWHNEDAS